MNILIVGGGSWDDTTSQGNTFSNLFAGWEDAHFYNLYFRETEPNNSVCKDYFRITTKEILKKFLVPHKIGGAFQLGEPRIGTRDRNGEKEKSAISLIHRYGLKSVYELEDWLWYSKKWQNRTLDQFVEQVNPDIIFSFAAGNSYMVLPTEYIKKKTNAKLILLVADDMHTTYRLAEDRHHKRMRRDLDRLMALADKVYGISVEMCDYYKKLYGVDVTPLYKGCFFEHEPKSVVNQPIRLIYAGNLLFGRLETLTALVDCLEELNRNEVVAVLEIYSGAIISNKDLQRLNRDKFSFFKGRIGYQEVKERMSEADIILHVESFEEEQIERVRYSFSTKIMDCLQSGSVMLAIGPKGISSVEYSRIIPGAMVIDDLQELQAGLSSLLMDKDGLAGRAEQIRRFALEKHSIDRVRSMLQKDFRSVCSADGEGLPDSTR